MSKKSNEADATLLKDKKHKAETVKNVVPAPKGTAAKLASSNPNGDPGKRK